MAIEVKHTTQATGTDAGNGEIRKAQWNEAHTLNMSSGNLLGRSTSGAGVVEEIAIGSGLSLSGGTLSASGGGGGSSTLTIQNKTAAYTVVAGDNGTIINCNHFSAFTVSLTAAATLGAGFNCWIWCLDAAITIDPNGSETIDGVATLVLRQGEGVQIVCDGTNWQTGGKKAMRMYAERLSPNFARPIASGSSSIALGYNARNSVAAQATNSAAVAISGTASGSSSIAAASGAAASGDYSTAIGYTASASGIYATAIGGDSVASGAGSTAIGTNSAYGAAKAVTGSGAMALGGSYASGADSFAAAVADNTSSYGAKNTSSIAIGGLSVSSANYAAAVGYNATATASGAAAFGYGGIASASYATCIGYSGTASGTYSVAIGNQSTASGAKSVAIGSSGLSAINGKYVYSNGRVGSVGDSQYGLQILRNATTDATAKVLISDYPDSSTAAATNQVILPNNSAYAFAGTVVARQSAAGGTASAAWKVEGLIRREGTAGTTTLVASTVTAISNVPGWTLALSADTTNGGLAVTATGAAATNIRWVATIQTSEVTYA